MGFASHFWIVLVATSMYMCLLSSVANVFVCGFVTSSSSSSPSLSQKQGQRKYWQTSNSYETRLNSSGNNSNDESITTTTTTAAAAGPGAELLKRELLQLAASYDRGYGATSRANSQVESIISKLEELNPEQNAIRGIDGSSSSSSSSDDSPLTGSWRMIWTTAADVLTLNANPLVTVGAIYQVFDLPCVTNVIDLLPPFQTLLGNQLGSVLRAKVTTRAYRGKNDNNANSNRIGLEFESVALEPVELLGNDVGFLPPLGFDFPRVPFEGFFDVGFLDEDLLIIRQNAPGGLFVLTKVDNFDP